MKKGKQLSKNSFNASNKDVKLRYPNNKQYTPASFEIKTYKSKINKQFKQFQKQNCPNNNYTPDLMRKLEMLKNMHNRKLQEFAKELENQRDLKDLNCSKTVPNDSEQQKPHDYSMQTSNLHTLPFVCLFIFIIVLLLSASTISDPQVFELWSLSMYPNMLFATSNGPFYLENLQDNSTYDMSMEIQYSYDITNFERLQ
ncbi:hypothetical protein C2G38_2162925 [Gigaspora rosea]|uniref:Uncharacterized protein n=1 Tax=Gigaspora rosea TaxID=44941 RepID=A0A397VXV5_9GLOM|nr:hypothetical protein C2G38_2162925 [Gigaspora rosea]